MSDREKTDGTVPVATASTEHREIVVARSLGGRQVRTAFNFDAVLGSFSSQEDVFNASVKPLVDQVLNGYEATAFAYGQTGTGKTYTMEGDAEAYDGAGLMQRSAVAMLSALADAKYAEHSVTVSYLEIYNEELSDLLAPAHHQPKLDLMDTHRGVCCVGLSEVPVQTLADINELVKAAQERRRMAETRMNARSSRSHCIFTMKVRCRKRVAGGELESVGKLHLVDLAGSECAKKAALEEAGQGQGMQRHGQAAASAEQERERRAINQSLLTLGRVIGALRDNSGRVPYRDSKLTRLLKDALGGNCKTVLIATISPALVAVEETISTLTYAEQANGIQNKPVASTLMRLTRLPNGESGDFSRTSSSCCGSADWAEAEMKIMYLTQEVEEAQSALARKFQEFQEVTERAETAEQELEVAKGEVSQLRRQLSSSAVAHEQAAAAARAQVAELQAAAAAGANARAAEQRELAELRGQRFVEEQILAMLQRQRQELNNDVAGIRKELEAARGELLSTKDEITGMQATQEKRCEDALQAVIQLATAEFKKVGYGLSEDIKRSCSHIEEARSRVAVASESASAVSARSADAEGKAAEKVSALCQDFTAKHAACQQRAAEARREIEAATSTVAEQLASNANTSDAAAAAAARVATCPPSDLANEDAAWKENQDSIAGKTPVEKIVAAEREAAQALSRVALKEVN